MVLENGSLPEGTEVTIIPSVSEAAPPAHQPMTIGQQLAELGRWAETIPCDLPEDLAKNHDHCIHGAPKKHD